MMQFYDMIFEYNVDYKKENYSTNIRQVGDDIINMFHNFVYCFPDDAALTATHHILLGKLKDLVGNVSDTADEYYKYVYGLDGLHIYARGDTMSDPKPIESRVMDNLKSPDVRHLGNDYAFDNNIV